MPFVTTLDLIRFGNDMAGEDTIRSADLKVPQNDERPASLLTKKIEQLEQKVDSATLELDKLKKSEGSLLKKTAVALGVIGALIAIPKGIVDSVSAIRQRPRTMIDWGAPLTVHYDLKARLLRFGFPIVFNNEGTADDTFESLSVDIHTIPDSSLFSATISDFELTLGQNESTQLPLPVAHNQPKQLHINLVLFAPFSERALSFDGTRAISVTFKTRGNQTISHSYCFDLDRNQGAEVLISQDKNIRTPDCE